MSPSDKSKQLKSSGSTPSGCRSTILAPNARVGLATRYCQLHRHSDPEGIGLAVQVLPLTNPLRTAEEAATVDHISKGRFDFGVGRSGLTRYYQGYNVPYAESRSRWKRSLSRRPGRRSSFPTLVTILISTTSRWSPNRIKNPLSVRALASAETFSLVGRMGHAIFVSANTPIPSCKSGWPCIGKHARRPVIPARGYRPAHPRLCGRDRGGRAEPEASTMHAIRYAATELITTAANPEIAVRMQRIANTPYDDILKQRLLYGTPETVVDRLQEYQDALGITGVVLEMNYGGRIPYERVINSVRLLAEKVAPTFK